VAPVTDLEEKSEEERDVRFMLSWFIPGVDDTSCSKTASKHLRGHQRGNDIKDLSLYLFTLNND
jgi:hypothetical protein